MLDILAELAPKRFTVEVYNGDTLENFQRRAFIKWARVYFNKRRTPDIGYQDFNFFDIGSIYTPLLEAISKTSQLNHTPLIMRSTLFKNSPYIGKPEHRGYCYIPANKNILVNMVWIPEHSLDYENLYRELVSGNTSVESILPQFIPHSPREIVRS